MRRKFKVSILLALISVSFLSFAILVFAGPLELDYPNVPQVHAPSTTKTFFPQFVKYLFNFAIIISGLIAFVSLVYGGFRYLTSAGSPVAMGEAKSQITAGILGLALILGSYLLLTTINPQLVILTVGKESYYKGVIIFRQANCPGMIEGEPTPDPALGLQEGTDYEYYRASSSTLRDIRGGDTYPESVGSMWIYNGNEDLEVFLYSEENYHGAEIAFKDHLAESCQPISSDPRSIFLYWKVPGAYLCDVPTSGGKCDGNERVYTQDTAEMSDFNDKVKALKFKDKFLCCSIGCDLEKCGEKTCKDPCPSTECGNLQCQNPVTNYGAILHEHPNFQGDCQVFLDAAAAANLDSTTCTNSGSGPFCAPDQEIKGRTSSITIFHEVLRSQQWGEGVTLYADYDFNEQEDGNQRDDCGISSGEGCICKPVPNLVFPTWVEGATGEATGSECEKLLSEEKASSIKIDGSYMAVVFREDGRCEVFRESDVRLKNNHIGDNQIKYLLVVPVTPETEE